MFGSYLKWQRKTGETFPWNNLYKYPYGASRLDAGAPGPYSNPPENRAHFHNKYKPRAMIPGGQYRSADA